MSDSEAAFRPVTVADRELVFRNPTAIQVALIQRLIKVVEASSTQASAKDATKDQSKRAYALMLESFAKVLDLIASLLPPVDAMWLSDQMLTGGVDDDAMLKMLEDLLPDEEPDEQVKPKANPKRVRRG